MNARRDPRSTRATRTLLLLLIAISTGVFLAVTGLSGNVAWAQDECSATAKAAAEQAMRDAVAADPELQAAYGEAWDLIERSLAHHGTVLATRVEPDRIEPLLARFDRPQRAVTPGQYVCLYDGDVCLGGGVIEEAR